MNIAIFANGERGYSVYKKLKNSSISTKLFISGKQNLESLKEFVDCDLKFFQNINNESTIEYLSRLEFDIFLVCGFSQIFKKEVFQIPRLGTINLHAGRLPLYRGGSPLNWQLINGEKKAGLSAILMDEGIDTGNILAENDFQISKEDDILSLHKKANLLFPELALKAIHELSNGNYGKVQNINEGSYWHQRQDQDGEINFNEFSAEQLHRFIKALKDPYPNAWANLNGRKIRFKESIISDPIIKGKPGKVIYLQSKGPFVICRDKGLLITKYHDEKDKKFFLENNMYFS